MKISAPCLFKFGLKVLENFKVEKSELYIFMLDSTEGSYPRVRWKLTSEGPYCNQDQIHTKTLYIKYKCEGLHHKPAKEMTDYGLFAGPSLLDVKKIHC